MFAREMILNISKITPCMRHNIHGFLIDEEWMKNNLRINELFQIEDGDGYTVHKYRVKLEYDKDTDTYNVYHLMAPWIEGESFAFVTLTDVASLYCFDFDGDNAFVVSSTETPSSYQYTWYDDPVGKYYVTNKLLFDMKTYFFNRDVFTDCFVKFIASNEKAFERLEDARYNFSSIGDFRIWTEEEEIYILHIPSGTMIGWYKFYHYGRSNFCNKREMTHKDLIEFFTLLRNQLLEEPDEPYPVKKEPYVEPSVTATETDTSSYDAPDVVSMYPTGDPLGVMDSMTTYAKLREQKKSDIKDSEGIKHRFEKEIDIQKAAERIAINSIYGASVPDPASMQPSPMKFVNVDFIWNDVKHWMLGNFYLPETNNIDVYTATCCRFGIQHNVWIIRQNDFIKLVGDTGDEIVIGYMGVEYSRKDEYERKKFARDWQIKFANPIIDKFYREFIMNRIW